MTESPRANWRTQRIHFSKKNILTTLAKSFRPPGPIRISRGRPIIGGWRVGRNPPSVRSVRFLRKTNQQHLCSCHYIMAFLVLNLQVGLQGRLRQIYSPCSTYTDSFSMPTATFNSLAISRVLLDCQGLMKTIDPHHRPYAHDACVDRSRTYFFFTRDSLDETVEHKPVRS